MLAIMFDVDDTLYDVSIPFCAACDKVFKEKYEISSMDLFLSGRKHDIPVVERIRKAFLSFGIEISEPEVTAFHDVYRIEQKKIELTAGMKEILGFCREKGIFTGVITNGFSQAQWNKIKQLRLEEWIPIERIIVSGDEGVRKPDPEIFKLAEKRFGLNPRDTWFIGDTYATDISGAVKAGWKSIWLNRRQDQLPDKQKHPDYTVAEERQLLNILETECSK
ncbi:HAD family hydrolase [Anaerostipes sp.]|uniref:HAD family hydrolase n=1 Tax=Anaerostipes sp. TaxID=1872530 RepID=UPI0025BA908D|nr:HAD family hydrolase [Anaerostipes sp.]MBS7007352.1 HAD family hydrolase [Anaerostipes sp.]